jgi:hypothetical protein
VLILQSYKKKKAALRQPRQRSTIQKFPQILTHALFAGINNHMHHKSSNNYRSISRRKKSKQRTVERNQEQMNLQTEKSHFTFLQKKKKTLKSPIPILQPTIPIPIRRSRHPLRGGARHDRIRRLRPSSGHVVIAAADPTSPVVVAAAPASPVDPAADPTSPVVVVVAPASPVDAAADPATPDVAAAGSGRP